MVNLSFGWLEYFSALVIYIGLMSNIQVYCSQIMQSLATMQESQFSTNYY